MAGSASGNSGGNTNTNTNSSNNPTNYGNSHSESFADRKKAENERNNRNNTNNVRAAADVASKTANPYAAAIGTGVKAADKVTGGKATEAIGKTMTKANQVVPGGNKVQKASNRISESGLGKRFSRRKANYQRPNQNVGGNDSDDQRMQEMRNKHQYEQQKLRKDQAILNKKDDNKGEQDGSPSSDEEKKSEKSLADNILNRKKRKSIFNRGEESNEENNEDSSVDTSAVIGKKLRNILLFLSPFILMVLIILYLICFVGSFLSSFDDFLGIGSFFGNIDFTGGIDYNFTSTDQENFLNRVNEISTNYANNGKPFDPELVVGTYNALVNNKATITYDDMDSAAIQEIVSGMFNEYEYDKNVFRKNLIASIIPKYLPQTSVLRREAIADEVFQSVNNYYDLIGKEVNDEDNCSKSTVCTYNIKGFTSKGKGNIEKKVEISNLYVQLNQCSSANVLSGEELIPFEDYLLGIGYMEFDDTNSKEALKAQFVALRSYVLAKPNVITSTNNKLYKDTSGKWILEVSTCSSDPLFCNPSKGCYTDNSNVLRSGKNQLTSMSKDPLPSDSILRSAIEEVKGEVLTNEQGYVVFTNYKSVSNTFQTLANKGLNYKSILLQAYNQGDNSSGVSNIYKSNCTTSEKCDTTSSSGGVSTGAYANWKQYEGPWVNVVLGNSGRTIREIGCLATSIAILIAKSGVPTNVSNFNPGTFVEYLNPRGGFDSGGAFSSYYNVSKIAPTFHYVDKDILNGQTKQEKFNRLKQLTETPGYYAIVKVKEYTGQHWVALDSVSGTTVNMMDPGSKSTNMFAQYNWEEVTQIVYFKVG